MLNDDLAILHERRSQVRVLVLQDQQAVALLDDAGSIRPQRPNDVAIDIKLLGASCQIDEERATLIAQIQGTKCPAESLNCHVALKIQQAAGTLKEFFHFDDGANQLWVDADFNDATAEQLNEGTSFVFLRQASAGTFTWTVPAETIAP